MAGCKNKYYTRVQPFLSQIEKWLDNGATEKQCADALKVPQSSWSNYKNRFKELDDLCNKPRVGLVLNLRGALVTRALGFSHKVRKAMKLKDIIYENGKKVRETERIEFYDEETYYPPETQAIFGALKIYDPDKLDYDIQSQSIQIKKEELELKKEMSKEQLW